MARFWYYYLNKVTSADGEKVLEKEKVLENTQTYSNHSSVILLYIYTNYIGTILYPLTNRILFLFCFRLSCQDVLL